jgi:hypothetical protein
LPSMTDFQPRWDWFRELGRQRPPRRVQAAPRLAGGSRAHQRKISTRQFAGGAVTMPRRVDLNRSEQIVAVCKRGRDRQSVPILNLPLPTPLPDGAEWIEAYRRWRAEG